VLRRLRARNSRIPVLILTAADSVEQRVKGLDLGADDYMAKPVRAVRTRGPGAGSDPPLAGRGPGGAAQWPLALDPAGRVATLNEVPLDLSARELGLLEI